MEMNPKPEALLARVEATVSGSHGLVAAALFASPEYTACQL
jgi:hypothetical protein